MRVLSIISALLVVASLYLLVFERERLLSFAGANAAQPVEADAEAAAETSEAAPLPEDGPEDGRVTVVALSLIHI